MAISDYGTLKTAVASYLDRSNLTSQIPDFISLGAYRIHYGSPGPMNSDPLRVPAMQARTSGTISSSAIAYPADFLELILLKATDGNRSWKLDYADTGTFTDLSNVADLPTVYTFLNNEIETAGTQGASYVLDYYSTFDAFMADADTNWLLTNAPQIYLFAALMESAPFIQDLPMVQAWHGMYRSAVNSLNLKGKSPGGGSLQVRAR